MNRTIIKRKHISLLQRSVIYQFYRIVFHTVVARCITRIDRLREKPDLYSRANAFAMFEHSEPKVHTRAQLVGIPRMLKCRSYEAI